MVPPLCNTSEHLNFRAGLLYRGGASDGTPLLGLLSSRMASRKVVLLLLLAATGYGQEIGDKSRFDQILSDFGFTGIAANPSKGVESPPSRQTVFNNEVLAEGKTSALSNLQAIASGQRGGHGLSDTFSRISPLSQPQPTRPQIPRRQPPRPRIVEDLRINSIPRGPVSKEGNAETALAALFKVAKSGSGAKSVAQAASQVLNDRATSPVVPKGRAAGVRNKQIISSERSFRGRGGVRGAESRGRGAADVAKQIRGSVGGKHRAASQGAARTGLRSSAEAQAGQGSSAANAVPTLSNPSPLIQTTQDSARLDFDETLAQFGFQPRLLSGHQSKTPTVKKDHQLTTPQQLQRGALQDKPAQAFGRSEGRLPSHKQAQTGESSALGSLRAIAAGATPGNLVVKNRGRTGTSPTVSAPLPKVQRPARPVSFSPPHEPPTQRPSSPSHSFPSGQPSPAAGPTPRPAPAQAAPQQLAPKALRGFLSADSPSNSALGKLQSIAAGEKPTLVARNRGRGQKLLGRQSASLGNPRQPARPASIPSITPVFQKDETTAEPVVNPFVNLELVTFPAVPRRGAETSPPPRATSPSRLRESEHRVAVEVPRSSVRSKAIGNEIIRAPSQEGSLSKSEDKRVQLPSRLEEGKEVEERRGKPSNNHQKKKKKSKKGGKPKRPSKQNLKLGLDSLGGAVAPGCRQICNSLIYEVYVLLGGHVCDCSL